MPQIDKEKRKEYNRLYYIKNKDKYNNKCEHKKQRSQCKDCGGSNICAHNRHRSICKECGGSSICEHKKRRSQCKDCGGVGICEHKKLRSTCKECGGGSICEHKRQRYSCKDCGGSGICEHNRHRSICKECGGGSICEHNRQCSQCKECLSIPEYLVVLQRSQLTRLRNLSTLPKTQQSIEYLSCTAEHFREYIEKKMTAEMNWNNIHIDHIKPVSVFDLNNHDDFLDCCHYTNMQPLIGEENLLKSNKWSDEDEVFWKENIRGKEYMQLYYPK
jgi:hypothetical protein